MPHFGHTLALPIVEEMTAVLTTMRAISSRSGSVWRAACWLVASVVPDSWDGVHTFDDIDADVPLNIEILLAFEWTQAAVHNFCLNDVA